MIEVSIKTRQSYNYNGKLRWVHEMGQHNCRFALLEEHFVFLSQRQLSDCNATFSQGHWFKKVQRGSLTYRLYIIVYTSVMSYWKPNQPNNVGSASGQSVTIITTQRQDN